MFSHDAVHLWWLILRPRNKLHCENTCFWGLGPGPIQTRLYNHNWQEMGRCLKIIENQSDCTIYDAANTKALISRLLTAQLICIFHAKIGFSHHVAISCTRMSQVIRNLFCQIRAERTMFSNVWNNFCIFVAMRMWLGAQCGWHKWLMGINYIIWKYSLKLQWCPVYYQ